MNTARAHALSTELDSVPSRSSWTCRLAWVVAAIALVAAATLLDAWIGGWLAGLVWPGSKLVARWISESAKGQWPLIAGLVALFVVWRLRRPDLRRIAIVFLAASTLAGVSASAMRGVIGRARPSNPQEQGWFGPYHNGRWIIVKHDYNSFPSGHTATAAGCAFALLLAGRSRRLGWVALAWAIAVAWSRVYLNDHYLSDTLASLLIGFAWAWLACRWAGVSFSSSSSPPPAPPPRIKPPNTAEYRC